MWQRSRAGQEDRSPDALGRRAFAAMCLLLVLGGSAIAQTNAPPVAVDHEAVLPENSDESDLPLPPAFNPVEVRPLTAADLPPSNPLVGGRLPRISLAFRPDWHAGRSAYRAIVEQEAQAVGLSPGLVDAVMAVESGYNPAVVGFDGEIGLMQILLPTARMMGFAGTAEQLAQPEINIRYGAKYLAGAWQLADGDLCTATMKYRAGLGETRFSYLSVEYCMRVRGHLAAQGEVVTGSVPRPTFGRPGASGGTHAYGLSAVRGGGFNLTALNTQLRAMTDRKSLTDGR
jgi:soluble lytic murein transglycosylase-like protein